MPEETRVGVDRVPRSDRRFRSEIADTAHHVIRANL